MHKIHKFCVFFIIKFQLMDIQFLINVYFFFSQVLLDWCGVNISVSPKRVECFWLCVILRIQKEVVKELNDLDYKDECRPFSTQVKARRIDLHDMFWQLGKNLGPSGCWKVILILSISIQWSIGIGKKCPQRSLCQQLFSGGSEASQRWSKKFPPI